MAKQVKEGNTGVVDVLDEGRLRGLQCSILGIFPQSTYHYGCYATTYVALHRTGGFHELVQ